MKIFPAVFFLFFFTCGILRAQVILPYSINTPGLPEDSAHLFKSSMPFDDDAEYFKYSGFLPGDIVADFTLYDTSGKATQLSKLLAEGKPVLLISGSYTCPRTRRSVVLLLDSLRQVYQDRINILFIYTLEAHPAPPDDCPYHNEVMIAAGERKNRTDHVSCHQPKNYYERKEMVRRFIRSTNIRVPVLIDSPDNAWWENFGPAPNNAYLLAPNGMVYRKWGWFDQADANAIDELLADSSTMKPDQKLFPVLSKSEKKGNTNLHIFQEDHYTITVYNGTGKNVFTEGRLSGHDYDLDKIALPPGEYALVVKVTDGHSYCIKWTR
jgi:hypothetical protein